MPFTPAHAAAVLPLLALRSRWLDGAALVAGAMAPDFEYFLRFRMSSGISHSWPGLFVFDVPVAVLLVVLFRRVVAAPLGRAAPARAGAWLSAPWRPGIVGVVRLFPSALLGATTHLLWDACTHRTGFVVERSPLLAHVFHLPVLGDVAVYRTLQHASTVLGLALLAVAWRRLPKDPHAAPVRATLITFVMLPLIAAAIAVAARMFANGGFMLSDYGHYVVAGMTGVVVAAIARRG